MSLRRRHNQRLRASDHAPRAASISARDPSELALVERVAEAPDDDAPRLVYADWLETRGDPRGEFIQLECQLARMAEDDVRRPALSMRADALNRAHAKDWLADLWSLRLPQTKFGFLRGFVETVAAPFSVVTSRAEEILARAPLLSSFELSVDGQVDRMELARPRSVLALKNAKSLAVKGRRRGNTRDYQGPIGQLGGLLGIPFSRLRSLRLADLRTSATDLGALLASPHLATLEELALNLSLDTAGVAAILDGPPSCKRLRRVALSHNPIGDEGVSLLARSNLLAGVTELDLIGIAMSRSGLAELLEANRLGSIERLRIGWNAIGDEGAIDLAAWRGGAKLVELLLRGTGVTRTGEGALLHSPNRNALRLLTID